MLGHGGRRREQTNVRSVPPQRLAEFRQHLTQSLPDYARPLFLRLRREMDVTSTFKQKKIDFVEQGFDPSVTADPIYFSDPAAKAFVRIDGALHKRIRDGGIRL